MAHLTFVTDTHALLWHIFPTPRALGKVARAAFDETDAGRARMLIPSVVVAEMIAVVERGRLASRYLLCSFSLTASDIAQTINSSPYVLKR